MSTKLEEQMGALEYDREKAIEEYMLATLIDY